LNIDRIVEREVKVPYYIDRPVDRIVEVPVDRIVEKSVDRIVERFVDRPVCKNIKKSNIMFRRDTVLITN